MTEISPEAVTQAWVESFIIGLNLCPFAKGPALREGIRYVRSRGEGPEEWLAEVLHECSLLAEQSGPETTLFILDDKLPSFLKYLDFFALAEALIETTDYADVIQIVSFHPEYCFEDATQDDPANATNQSPYPCIHLIKRADVAMAAASHPDISQIPKDNIATLRGDAHHSED